MNDKKTEKLYQKALAAARTPRGRAVVFGAKMPSARSVEKMFGLQEGETYEYEDRATTDGGKVRIGKYTGLLTLNENTSYWDVWVKGFGTLGGGYSKAEAVAEAREKMKSMSKDELKKVDAQLAAWKQEGF